LDFAALIELELDFSGEDVEFADRTKFKELVAKITFVLKRLIDSFSFGNALKNGIPVAIIGEPNVGKSTLLNTLLNEEKAIVSDIAGTTRDAIEDEIIIEGVAFRFIDTAGIRTTEDTIESIGIKKTFEKITQSQVVLYLLDASKVTTKTITLFNNNIRKIQDQYPDKQLIVVANKMDQADKGFIETSFVYPHTLFTSAKSGLGIDALKIKLLEFVNTGALRNNDTIITNSRHYDSLLKALSDVQRVQQGMDAQLSGDLLAIDIRQGLFHFGEITGEITSDDLLGNIFANFCIGK
jgi:tRNA modification GTPase